MVYNMVMARKEVLVQLDDRLVAELDRIAAEHAVNRSELIRRIAQAFVRAEDEAKADAQLVAAYQAMPDDPAEIDALMRIALETWPEW
jgi:metal-responsive CopG/Arc/MetJ family transcriptional regulator